MSHHININMVFKYKGLTVDLIDKVHSWDIFWQVCGLSTARMCSTTSSLLSHSSARWGLRDTLLTSTSASSGWAPPTWTSTTWGLGRRISVSTSLQWTPSWITRLRQQTFDRRTEYYCTRDRTTVWQVGLTCGWQSAGNFVPF